MIGSIATRAMRCVTAAILFVSAVPSSAFVAVCDQTQRSSFVFVSLTPGIEDADYVSPMRQRPRPEGGDTAYTSENILRQLRHYNQMRQVGGTECVDDIYAKDPTPAGDDVRFWFVGKVARCTSAELAVARQFNLLEEHACRIRPVELGRSFGDLELFAAPGDTELLTARNDPGIRLQPMPRTVEGSDRIALLEVGLNLEIVTNQGAGFCILRTKDGVVPPRLIGE